MFISPRNRRFRAKGDGQDDSVQLQAWADWGAGKSLILDRWHASSTPIQFHPGTTVYSYGGGIAAHAGYPLTAAPLILPASGCRFFDVGFRGTPELREVMHGAMVSVANADSVLFSGCSFSWWRTLVAMAATNRVKFSGCEFAHWADSRMLPDRDSPEGKAIIAANATLPDGERKPEYELALRGHCLDDGGYALLGGNGSWPNDNVDVIGCRFHDGNWTAIDCLQPLGIKWRIFNTTIERVHECGIYCGASAVIERVTILDVRRRDCSAHCIEGGGLGTRITHSTFGRPDAAFIFIANPVGMYIGHNTMFDPMQEASPDSDPTPWSAGLFVRNLPAAPEHLANGLVVEHNDMWCSTGKATHCAFMYDAGGGPLKNITYGPNRMAGTWKGRPLECDPAAMGEGFHVIDH